MNSMYKLLLVVSLFQYLSGGVVRVQVDPEKNTLGECTLSHFVESIEYVPLETNDKCLISNIKDFDISDNYIIVTCVKTRVAYLFHRDGRFISQVGDVGGGPGEYLGGASSVFIDEKREQVLIVAQYQKKLLVYNLKGKFLRAEDMGQNNSVGSYRLFYNDLFYIDTRNYNGNFPFVYEIRSRDFNLITEDIPSVPFEKRGNIWTGVGAHGKYIYDGKVHTKELSLNDTIYIIGNDFSYKPKYVVNAGKYEVTPELRGESDGYEYLKKMESCVSFKSFFETDNCLLFSYLYGKEKFYYCYYEKNKQKLFHFPSNTGIPNDYDGGLDFWPQKQNGRMWYAFYNAYLFEEAMSSEKKIPLKGPVKDICAYDNLMKKLDVDDNPILVIVKLKNVTQ